ncbi:MAG: hypothetical protein A2Z09_02445 [Nitrospirae bacterium RBG_16_43_8]|nr:MAG: hypothetical protein A2Z09_02445 [Nitrospirae bacterium RBG_16_43_8]
MTKVVVNPGICGFPVTVIAEKREGKKIHISLDTECEMVKKMAEDIASLEMMASFTGLAINPVYKSAAQHLKHAACPVPSAILKAVEVEAGLCIPKDVNISFVSD